MNILVLHHRAVLERNQQTSADDWGQTAAPDWQPGPCVVACRAWVDKAGRIEVDSKIVVHSSTLRMIVDLGSDITLKDRVARIEDSAGSVLWDGPMAIETIDRTSSHFEIAISDKASVNV